MSGSTAKNNLHSKFAVFILVFSCISINVSAITCSQDYVDNYFPKIEWNFSWGGMLFGLFKNDTNFTAAQCICRGKDENSRLAILESLDMWRELSSYLLLHHDDEQFWVDATRPTTDPAGNYTWGDGCPLALDSPMWITGEPTVGERTARLKKKNGMMRLGGLYTSSYWPLCQKGDFGPGSSAESLAPAPLTTADTMGGETTPSTHVTLASSGLSTGTTRSQLITTIPSSSSETLTSSSSSPESSTVSSSASPYSTTTTSSASNPPSSPSSSSTTPYATTTTSSSSIPSSSPSSSSTFPHSTTSTSSSSIPSSSSSSSSSSTSSSPATTTASSLPSSTSFSISFSSSSSTNTTNPPPLPDPPLSSSPLIAVNASNLARAW